MRGNKTRRIQLEGNATEIFFLLPRSIDLITANPPPPCRLSLFCSLTLLNGRDETTECAGPPIYVRRADQSSPFRFLKAITKVTSRTESFLTGKRKSAIMQWKRQFPAVLSRRSVSLFLRAPLGEQRLLFFFCRKTDGKFRAPDAPTFNARRSRLGAFRSNLRIDDTIHNTIHGALPSPRRNAPSRARARSTSRKTDDAVEAPFDE